MNKAIVTSTLNEIVKNLAIIFGWINVLFGMGLMANGEGGKMMTITGLLLLFLIVPFE